MKKILFLAFLVASNAFAADLDISEQGFIDKYNDYIDDAKISKEDKSNLKIDAFESKKNGRLTRSGDSIIFTADKNNNGKLDAVGVLYLASDNGLSIDSKEVAARDAMLKTVIGEDAFKSSELSVVKNEMDDKYDKSPPHVHINGYEVTAKYSKDMQGIMVAKK